MGLSTPLSISLRATQLAVEVIGSVQGLAAYLDVPLATAMGWLSGAAPIPREHFLRVVDLVCNDLSRSERHALAAARHVTQISSLESRVDDD